MHLENAIPFELLAALVRVGLAPPPQAATSSGVATSVATSIARTRILDATLTVVGSGIIATRISNGG
jgi:hypothetical protein